MREYETVYILNAKATEKESNDLNDRLKRLVQEHKGKILFVRPWGRRAFAYTLEKQNEGIYFHLDYAGDTQLVSELERILRLDEKVLRFLTVQLQDSVDIAAREKQLAEQTAQLEAATQTERV